MRKYLFLFLAAFALSGCSEDEVIDPSTGPDTDNGTDETIVMPVFEASMDAVGSRASLASDDNIHWDAKDSISVFATSDANLHYRLEGNGGTTEGTFRAVQPSTAEGNPLQGNAAVYPYRPSNSVSGQFNNLNFNVEFPAQQIYAHNSFPHAAFSMVATSNDNHFQFKNACSVLQLKLKGDAKIANIRIMGHGEEVIAGSAKVSLPFNGEPTVTMPQTETGKVVLLDCTDAMGGGVQLSSAQSTSFYIVLPPVTFTTGFRVVITDTQKGSMKLDAYGEQQFQLNGILEMPEVNYVARTIDPLLVDGSTFNARLKELAGNDLSTVGSLTFEVNSNRISEGAVTVNAQGAMNAYMVKESTGIVVFTKAEEFFFNPNCDNMFAGCSAITTLDLKDCNTINVTSMNNMFSGCTALTSLDLMYMDVSNVTTMQNMFAGCTGLYTLDLSSLNTSQVTDMSGMMKGCSKLNNIYMVGVFKTSKVKNFASMFQGCSAVTSLNLSNFRTAQADNMNAMFSGCTRLTGITWGAWFKTAQVTDMSNMFHSLAAQGDPYSKLDLRFFDMKQVTKLDGMFSSARFGNLILGSDAPDNATSTSMFSETTVSELLDLGSKFYVTVEPDGKNFFNAAISNIKSREDFKAQVQSVQQGQNGTFAPSSWEVYPDTASSVN